MECWKIVPKMSGAHGVLDARVARRHEPRRDDERGVAAEPFHPLFLDDPQQLALRLDWELCDGIEVHRPRFRSGRPQRWTM